MYVVFFFSSRRRHTRSLCDWSSDVCSSDLPWTAFAKRQRDCGAGAEVEGTERLASQSQCGGKRECRTAESRGPRASFSFQFAIREDPSDRRALRLFRCACVLEPISFESEKPRPGARSGGEPAGRTIFL